MRRGLKAIGLGAAAGLAGAGALLVPGVLALEESAGLRLLFRWRGVVAPPDEVALVSIAEESAEALGVDSREIDEWPRSLHAALVDRLARAGASVIAIDIIFEDATEPGEDEALAASMRRAGNVLVLDRIVTPALDVGAGVRSLYEKREPPHAPIERAAVAHVPFVLPQVPVQVNQFWAFGRSAAAAPNLPSAALQMHLAGAYAELADALCDAGVECAGLPRDRAALVGGGELASAMTHIRDAFVADATLAARVRARLSSADALRLVDLYDGPSGRYLNFYGPAGTIATMPMHRVLERGAAELDLEGKVVFVGFAETLQPEQQDEFYTVFSEGTGQDLAGVEIGATAFANLLAGTVLRTPSMQSQLAIVLALGFVLGLAAVPRAITSAALAGLAATGVYVALAYAAFVHVTVWLPLVVPVGIVAPLWLVALLAWRYREVTEQRARIEAALGQYVPARHVRRLARESAAGPAAELLEGVCLYTDAEQYTRIAERLGPAELAGLMNDYYQVICGAAETHAGLVADISGDSMVSIWAAAGPDPALAPDACRGALAIVDAVDEFNRGHSWGRLPTRIGLDAGRMLLGDIGSRRRREYRAVGEIVTTAARIQGLNRVLGTRLLLTDGVAGGLDGFVTRRVGRFLLLGKTAAVSVHELCAEFADGPTQAEWMDRFELGLERFGRREWRAAAEEFEAVLRLRPEDGPARFYIECCGRYAGLVLAPDWAGTVRIEVK